MAFLILITPHKDNNNLEPHCHAVTFASATPTAHSCTRAGNTNLGESNDRILLQFALDQAISEMMATVLGDRVPSTIIRSILH